MRYAAAPLLPPIVPDPVLARRAVVGCIEPLEQRVAPAVVASHWVGGSGNWSDPAHWDNGVPNNDNGLGHSYTAILDVAGTPTIMIDSAIHVTGLDSAEAIALSGSGNFVVGDSSALVNSSLLNNAGGITIGGTSTFTASFPISQLTTAKLGDVHVTGGTFKLQAAVINTGATLTVDAPAGAWVIDGGSIIGGTVSATAGSKIQASASLSTILDGVTMNADLDLTQSSNTLLAVTIKHGLTLNGTTTVGANAFLNFEGTQTLGGTGTVVLTDSAASGIIQDGTMPTLTIGSIMTIRGGSSQGLGGTMGDSDFLGTVANGTIINEGTISADATGTITFKRSKIINHGTIEATGGGNIYIDNLSTNSGTLRADLGRGLIIEGDHWTNTGTLSGNSSFVYLGGVFTTAGLGTLSLSEGQVHLSGKLENTDATFTLDSLTSWYLGRGTIQGGTVQSSNDSVLHLTAVGGILDGVTMNANLEVNDGQSSTRAEIRHGLTLNGIATVGESSYLSFAGSQTLGGTGSVVFLNNDNSALIVSESGTTLTIGPTMTIRGGSSQQDGARIGYSDYFVGPTDFTLVNFGKISADVNGTSINIPQGRFINAGILEEINGGTIHDPTLIATEKKVLSKTSAPYAFQDADSTPVSVQWLGAGSVTLVRFNGGTGAHGDLYSVTTNGSDLTSSLTFTTIGVAGTTSVENIDINGSLRSLTAPKTDLLGNVTSTKSVGALTLGKVVNGSTIKLGPRATGDTRTATALTFDLVKNLQIDASTPLLSLAAVQWLDDDSTPDVISAPSLGTLTIKAAANRNLSADFEGGLKLSGAGVLPKGLTLGKATIGGKISGSDWLVQGNAGTISAGSTGADWTTHILGSLVSLTTTGQASGNLNVGARAAGDVTTATSFTFGVAEELSIRSLTPIKTLTALQWLDLTGAADVIVAPSLAALTITGSGTQNIAGDFQADLTLSGAGVAAKKPTLGAATVEGKITGSAWDITGPTTSLKAGALAADFAGTFHAPVGSLTTTGNASGVIIIGARPTGDLTSKTTLKFDTASELQVTSLTPLASLATRQWIDRDGTPDIVKAVSLGSLKVTGDTRVTRPLPGDFEAGLHLTGTGVAAAATTLGSVTVRGKIDTATWAVTGNAGAITVGSIGSIWNATFTKALTSLTATTVSGTLHAASIGTIKATALDSADIRTDGNIGTVTLVKMQNSRLFAGVQSGVTSLPQTSAGFASVATIAKITVSGVANSNDPAMVNSFIATSKITSASITNFAASNNGTPYGLAADTIATLTLKTGATSVTQTKLDTTTADASAGSDDFIVRIF